MQEDKLSIEPLKTDYFNSKYSFKSGLNVIRSKFNRFWFVFDRTIKKLTVGTCDRNSWSFESLGKYERYKAYN